MGARVFPLVPIYGPRPSKPKPPAPPPPPPPDPVPDVVRAIEL